MCDCQSDFIEVQANTYSAKSLVLQRGIHATMVSLDESMVSIGTAFLVISLVGLSLFHIFNIRI